MSSNAALHSDPAERWQSARDIEREIEWAETIREPAPAVARPPLIGWIVAGLACVGMLALGVAYLRRAPLPPPLTTRFTMSLEKEMGGTNTFPVPSPTGELLVFTGLGADGGTSLWIRPLNSAEAVRLPGTEGADDPVWSPDGRRLLFGTDREGGADSATYMKLSMDTGRAESRFVPAPAEPHGWSADGRWIAYWQANDIYVGRASGNLQPFPLVKTDARETVPRFSPDGKWIAYTSNESGRVEVYVRSFSADGTTTGGALRVSNNGGEYGVWGPSGQEIFYMTRDASIYAVDARLLGKTGTLPAPVRLFHACTQTGGPSIDTLSVQTNDGRRFLVNCRVEPIHRSHKLAAIRRTTHQASGLPL